MRKKIRLLAIILLVFNIISIIPASPFVAVAEDASEGNSGLQYVEFDGCYYVVGYDGTGGVVTIPNSYNGKPVIGIEYGTFSWNNDITAVIIEAEGITELINGEFEGCDALEYIKIPATVVDITGITMWAGNVIPEIIYYGSEGELTYDSSEIGKIIYNYIDHAHEYNGRKIAPTCTAIGYTEFVCSCGDSYKNDVVNALGHKYSDKLDTECNNCGEVRALETLIAEGTCGVSVSWKLREDGTLVIYGNGAMEDFFNVSAQPWKPYASQITKLVIEEGVTFISRCAFYGYTAIKEVSLPSTLMAIEEYAFFGCSGITKMTIPSKVFYIGAYALRKTKVTELNFEDTEGWAFTTGETVDFGSMKTIVAAFNTNLTYKKVCMKAVDDEGELIAGGTFGNNFKWTLSDTGVLRVNGSGAMPKFNVNTTPWYGYRGAIRSVIIGEGITSVGRCSFHTCREIVSVTLPESLETIVEYAFYNCINVKSVDIPKKVTRIEIYAFRKCFELTDIDFGIKYGWSAGDTAISVNELTGSTAADTLTLEYYTVVWIRDVNAEEEIADPNYVTGGMCKTFAKWQLYWINKEKTKMKLVITGNDAIPDYGTGKTPWYGYADQITEIVVEEGITGLGRCAFYGMKKVKTVTLPETLTYIGEYAFNTCYALTELYIPAAVERIEAQAFAKSGLASVTFAKCAGWTLSDGVMIETSDMANKANAAVYLRDTYKAFSMTRDPSVPEAMPDNGWYGGKYYIGGECVVSTEMWIGADYYSFDADGNATRITKDDGFTGNY